MTKFYENDNFVVVTGDIQNYMVVADILGQESKYFPEKVLGYRVVNKLSNVVEHETKLLIDAIRASQEFEKQLSELMLEDTIASETQKEPKATQCH